MKSIISLQGDSKEKIQLLIAIAREMGLDVEHEGDVVSEPAGAYSGKSPTKKIAFIAEASSQEKLDVLLKVAGEMGVILHPLNAYTEMDEEQEKEFWEKVALHEMARDWEHPAEDVWDDFIKSRLKL